jgi:hypothetical protein
MRSTIGVILDGQRRLDVNRETINTGFVITSRPALAVAFSAGVPDRTSAPNF